jgi:hypothetical protein
MTTLARAALAATLTLTLALPALAEDKPAGGDPMASWSPPTIKNEKKDRQEIEAVLKAMEAASLKGDLDAAVKHVDFPVLMVTDDQKGEAQGGPWSKEQWVEMMKPMYAKPMPADAMKPGKREITLLSDSLALVSSAWTMKMGPKSVSGKSGMIMIRKDGQWMTKAMVEGGWGNMPMPQGATAPTSTAPAR